MNRYIGLDAHSESCTIAVMGETGRRLRKQVLDTRADVLIDFFKGIAGHKCLCLEDGQLAEWLVEVLEPHVDKLVVIQPEKHAGQKSDEEDAWSLAEHIRVRAKGVHVFKPTHELRELREAARMYMVSVKEIVRAKGRLRARFRSRGMRELTNAIYDDPETRRECISMLPKEFRPRVKWLGEQVDAMSRLHDVAQSTLEKSAKKNADVLRLATIPSIGIVRAAMIVAIVVVPHRFRTTRQFWTYCGLGIVRRSSSDFEKSPNGNWRRRTKGIQIRGLNPNRNAVLKYVFKGAATCVIRQTNHPLRRHYDQMVAQGTAPHLARLTIARRIAATALAMFKKKEAYQPEKYLAPAPAPA